MRLQTEIDQLLPRAQFLEFVRDDYARFLAEYGLTAAWVTAVVADMSDHAEMPPGYDRYVGPVRDPWARSIHQRSHSGGSASSPRSLGQSPDRGGSTDQSLASTQLSI